MKKIVLINCGDNGSTGKICMSLLKCANDNGFEAFFAAHFIDESNRNDHFLDIDNGRPDFTLNKILCRIDGSDGFRNKKATVRLVKKLEQIKPDIIHLHNLHGHFINIEILFSYIRKNNIKVVWTLHDCWSFTGRCPHFDFYGCEQWKTGCGKCKKQHLKDYPAAYLINRPNVYYEKKNKLFTGMQSLITFVTPSIWLMNLLKESMLKDFKCVCINNGIRITDDNKVSDVFINSLNLDVKKTILFSAAYPFSDTKGINHVINISKNLDYDKYEYIVAGLDFKQEKLIDTRTKSVGIVRNQDVIRSLYNVADCFINPTLQDTFPTVNLESLSAGTPIITFNSGGSPEVVKEGCGVIVERDNFEELLAAINKTTKKQESTIALCKEEAKKYTEEKMCKEYIKLYKTL